MHPRLTATLPWSYLCVTAGTCSAFRTSPNHPRQEPLVPLSQTTCRGGWCVHGVIQCGVGARRGCAPRACQFSPAFAFGSLPGCIVRRRGSPKLLHDGQVRETQHQSWPRARSFVLTHCCLRGGSRSRSKCGIVLAGFVHLSLVKGTDSEGGHCRLTRAGHPATPHRPYLRPVRCRQEVHPPHVPGSRPAGGRRRATARRPLVGVRARVDQVPVCVLPLEGLCVPRVARTFSTRRQEVSCARAAPSRACLHPFSRG